MELSKNYDLVDVTDLTFEILSEFIRAWLRKEESRTIADFARKAKVSERTVKSILNHEKNDPNPTIQNLKNIARALNMKITLTPIDDKDVIK